jgi:hypothetical protein
MCGKPLQARELTETLSAVNLQMQIAFETEFQQITQQVTNIKVTTL